MANLTKDQLSTQISTVFADNTAGDISASDIRDHFTDEIDSLDFRWVGLAPVTGANVNIDADAGNLVRMITNGTERDVSFAATTARDGLKIGVINAGAENVLVKPDGVTTLATLAPNEFGIFIYNNAGTVWEVLKSNISSGGSSGSSSLPTYNPTYVYGDGRLRAVATNLSASASDFLLYSYWFTPTNAGFSDDVLATAYDSTNHLNDIYFRITRNSSNALEIIIKDSSFTTLLDFVSANSLLPDGEGHHILISYDSNQTTPVLHCYIDGVDVVPGATTDTRTQGNMDWTTATNRDWGFNGYTSTTQLSRIWVTDLYLTNEYLDLSDTSNRYKFISETGLPAYLGSDGSTPTGTQPLVFLGSGESASDWDSGVNLGSGGNFSVFGNWNPYNEGSEYSISRGFPQIVTTTDGINFYGPGDPEVNANTYMSCIIQGDGGTAGFRIRSELDTNTRAQMLYNDTTNILSINNSGSSSAGIELDNTLWRRTNSNPTGGLNSDRLDMVGNTNTGQWWKKKGSTNHNQDYYPLVDFEVRIISGTQTIDTTDEYEDRWGQILQASANTTFNLNINSPNDWFCFFRVLDGGLVDFSSSTSTVNGAHKLMAGDLAFVYKDSTGDFDVTLMNSNRQHDSIDSTDAIRTITAADSRQLMEHTGSVARVYTIPETSTEEIPAAAEFHIYVSGTGSVTLTTQGTDTLNGASSVAAGEYCKLVKITDGSPNTWLAVIY